MQKFDFVSKQELIVLLYQVLDGVEGYECEQGSAALRRYWQPKYLQRARTVIAQAQAEIENHQASS